MRHYVCDSCGRVVKADLLQTVIDEEGESYDLCPICRGVEEDNGQYNRISGR